MNDKAREYREKLKVETSDITGDIPENFNMYYMPTITFIDDNPSIVKIIKQILPSVKCEVMCIDDVIRCISNELVGFFEDVDMIFVDGFYRDRETNKYAIDYFDMYRKLNDETIVETEGKYKVVVSIDEINERIRKKTVEDTDVVDENLNISALYARMKKHPRLEWRGRDGKIDTIIQAIEEYAQRNKIYLYKNSEMSFKEWIGYIKSLENEINNTIQNLQEYKGSRELVEEINNLICEFRNAIEELYKQFGDSSRTKKVLTIKSIADAVECTKMLYKKVVIPLKKMLDLGNEKSEDELCSFAHELSHFLLDADFKCYRAEEYLEKKTLESNSK